MKCVLLAGFAVFALAGSAHAQRESGITGTKLAEICASSDPRQVEGCEAYLTAVTDSALVYQRLRPADGSKGGKLPGYICVPASVTGGQMRERFVQWMAAKSNQGQRIGAGVVLSAMLEMFPCGGGGRKEL